MANPTTNYGFVLPTSSDLVTDLPADFDVALQGVDTRLKALQPGTTLGDLAYSSATANTNTRLGIGTSGQVLAVSGGVPAWTTPAAAGSMTLLSTTTLSAATTTVSSISQSYKHLYIEVLGIDVTAFNPTINYLTNSGGLYFSGFQSTGGTPSLYQTSGMTVGNAQNYGGAMPVNKAAIWVYDYTDATNRKVGLFDHYWVNEGGSPIYIFGQIVTSHSGAMTSFSMTVSTGSYDAGTIKVYGVN